MVPARLSASQQRALVDLTQAVVAMYGDSITGAIHFEAKILGDVARPIELNLRLGGAETYMLIKAAYGVRLRARFACSCAGGHDVRGPPDAAWRDAQHLVVPCDRRIH